MPVKLRAAKGRRQSFTPEVLGLFSELDAVPVRRRHSEDFKAKHRKLAQQLDLVSEYWTINSVLDRSAGPCHPPGYVAHQDWFTCRRVRTELLAALRTTSRP
jgi:hypothetical protein